MLQLFYLIILHLLVVSSACADTNNDAPRPEELLAQLNMAMQEQSYVGDFTYEHGSKIESFRVYHVVNGGDERDLLFRLTGNEQVFVRQSQSTCGTVGNLLLGGGRLTASDGEMFSLNRHYKTVLLGRDRIADRYVWVVQLAPKDQHRYGITLAIDDESYLLMRYVIYDARKKTALERMQFTSIRALDPSDELNLSPDYFRAVAPQQCVGDSFTPVALSPWRPAWLPPGFILTGYEHTEDGHMETYTDGVSSFSIFVNSENTSPPLQTRVSSRGAAMALLSSLPYGEQAVSISVVGEIPMSTAQKISLSMQQRSRGPAE